MISVLLQANGESIGRSVVTGTFRRDVRIESDEKKPDTVRRLNSGKGSCPMKKGAFSLTNPHDWRSEQKVVGLVSLFPVGMHDFHVDCRSTIGGTVSGG